MAEKEFNLLDEPWIRVMLPDCTIREVSLLEALTQAHAFSALAGELATQDMAILRVLLAVLHTVFSRTDADGEPYPIENEDDALGRWQALWSLRRLPEEPIRAYLEKWRERFYLFHPERPFYQVAQATNGTEFTAAKLNGAISESSNKVRLFPMRAGAEKNRLSYAEAARWLIYLNGFDDTSAKPKQKNLPSPGAGWLGKLGLIAAQGENLFETLMLNLTLLDDLNGLWGENRPVWELERPRTQERCEIPMPDNQAELLTLQSRRLLLQREGQWVTGYRLLGGDFFNKVNAYAEQMTLWKHEPGKSSQPPYDQPRRHDPSRQIWREFPAIAGGNPDGDKEANGRIPGVVHWQKTLQYNGALEQTRMARFKIAGVQFGDKDFFVTDAFSDELSFHLNLLAEAGQDWLDKIEAELARTDRVATAVTLLGKNLEKAAGGDGAAQGEKMKEQFYGRVDMPFRRFLESVDPADDYETKIERLNEWRAEEYRIARRLGDEAVAQAGQAAFVGRTLKEKIKGKEEERHYSAPEACNQFIRQINRELK